MKTYRNSLSVNPVTKVVLQILVYTDCLSLCALSPEADDGWKIGHGGKPIADGLKGVTMGPVGLDPIRLPGWSSRDL